MDEWTKGTQAKVARMNERIIVSFSVDIEYIKRGKAIWIFKINKVNRKNKNKPQK